MCHAAKSAIGVSAIGVRLVSDSNEFRWFPSVTDRLIAFKPPAFFSGQSGLLSIQIGLTKCH